MTETQPEVVTGTWGRGRGALVGLGVAAGALGAAASAGLIPAVAELVLAVATLAGLALAVQPLSTVTVVVLPLLAVASNLPAPIQIAGLNLRYIFLVVPPLLALWLLRTASRKGRLLVPDALRTLARRTWLSSSAIGGYGIDTAWRWKAAALRRGPSGRVGRR